jgi:hypothetical protein
MATNTRTDTESFTVVEVPSTYLMVPSHLVGALVNILTASEAVDYDWTPRAYKRRPEVDRRKYSITPLTVTDLAKMALEE